MKLLELTPRLKRLLVLLAVASTVLVVQKTVQSRIRAWETPSILNTSENNANGRGSVEILSAPYRLDRVYQSMEGPSGNQGGIKLSPERGNDEVLYVTGVKSEVVDKDNKHSVSQEYFCHANLTLSQMSTDPETHNQGFARPTHMDWRLATLMPGRMEMKLPEGFGVPVKNGTLLDYFSMSINQNESAPRQTVRFRSKIDYTSAADTRALFRRSIYVHQKFRESVPDLTQTVTADAQAGVHVGAQCGSSCGRNQLSTIPSLAIDLSKPSHPGAACCVVSASMGGAARQFGEDSTIHWMVPPGEHSYTSDVSPQFELPFDTTAHYITGHLHPFGKRMRLIDKDNSCVVFEITSKDFSDKLGVQYMSEIINKPGVKLRKGGHYELVADYNNTTASPIDAMAIMYVYLAEDPDKSSSGAGRGIAAASN